MTQFLSFFFIKLKKFFLKKTPFTIYRQMQLDELIPNITLVLHEKNVLFSKTGIWAQKPRF
jgi:hypothetical protein